MSVCTVAGTASGPTPTDSVLSWIWLTKVTEPPASTETTGGVRSRMVTVAVGAALARGASSTEVTSTPSHPTTRAAMPRRALRRIPPLAMLTLPPGPTAPLLTGNPRHAAGTTMCERGYGQTRSPRRTRVGSVAAHPIGVHVGPGVTEDGDLEN